MFKQINRYVLGENLNRTVYNKSTFLQDATSSMAIYNNHTGKATEEKPVIFSSRLAMYFFQTHILAFPP